MCISTNSPVLVASVSICVVFLGGQGSLIRIEGSGIDWAFDNKGPGSKFPLLSPFWTKPGLTSLHLTFKPESLKEAQMPYLIKYSWWQRYGYSKAGTNGTRGKIIWH